MLNQEPHINSKKLPATSYKLVTYKDLIVWQKAMSLVVTVYALTEQFPKEELYGLTSQMRRAAVSIPSNINDT